MIVHTDQGARIHLFYCSFNFMRCLYYFSDRDVQFFQMSFLDPYFQLAKRWFYKGQIILGFMGKVYCLGGLNSRLDLRAQHEVVWHLHLHSPHESALKSRIQVVGGESRSNATSFPSCSCPIKASIFSQDESSSRSYILYLLLSNFNGLHSFSISCRKEPLKVSLSNISS